jgi:uncharacterized protein
MWYVHICILVMRFEWDFNKDALNQRNHGVSFQEAAEAFADPNALETFDAEHSGEESCWIRIGSQANGSCWWSI